MNTKMKDTDIDFEEWGIPLRAKAEQKALWKRMAVIWRKFAGIIPEPSLDIGAARQQGHTVSLDPYPRGFVDVRALGEQLPFKDACFTSVVIESVLKHVLSPIQTLSEARRVLSRDGYLFVTSPVNHIDKHRHSFSSEQLCKIIEESGFKITKKMGLGLSFNRLDRILRRRFSKIYLVIRPPIRFCRNIFLIAKAI